MDGVEVLNSWKGVLNVIYRYGGLLKDFYKWVFIIVIYCEMFVLINFKCNSIFFYFRSVWIRILIKNEKRIIYNVFGVI